LEQPGEWLERTLKRMIKGGHGINQLLKGAGDACVHYGRPAARFAPLLVGLLAWAGRIAVVGTTGG